MDARWENEFFLILNFFPKIKFHLLRPLPVPCKEALFHLNVREFSVIVHKFCRNKLVCYFKERISALTDVRLFPLLYFERKLHVKSSV